MLIVCVVYAHVHVYVCYISHNKWCNGVFRSFSDQEEMCDNTTVSFELSTQLLVPSDTPQGYQIPTKSRRYIVI